MDTNPVEPNEQPEQAQALVGRQNRSIIISAIALVAVLAVLAGGLFSWHRKGQADKEAQARASQAAPAQGPTGSRKAYEELQAVKVKPSVADKEGGLTISAKGMGRKEHGVPIVHVFVDPMCPWCGKVGRVIDPRLEKMVEAGQITVTYTFLNFLDKVSSDHYSTRVGNALATVAEEDPDHFLAFESAIFEEGFQPDEESYKPVTDQQLADQAGKAGVPESVTARFADGRYQDWVKKVNDYTITRKDVKDSKGEFTTPTILINGRHWDISAAGKASGGLGHLDSTLVKSLGLDASQVGRRGTTPSIGSEGKPLPF